MLTYKLFSRRGLHVVSVGIGVLQGVSALGQERGRVQQVLPVDPGAAAAHHLIETIGFVRQTFLGYLTISTQFVLHIQK